MTRLIIHIGTHKTGTTALQKALVRERRSLEKKGIHYEWMDLAHDKHERAYLDIGSDSSTKETRAKYVEDVKSAIAGKKTVILSEEGLSEPGEMFAETLSPLLDVAEVKVVCVLRPQHELIERLWAQHLREQKTQLSIEDFTQAGNTQERCNYYRMLGYWGKCFGEENLKVLNYEDVKEDSPNGIFRAVGIDHVFEKDFPRQNWTPNAQKTRLIEFLNSVNAVYDVQEILRAGHPADEIGAYSVLSDGLREQIEERNQSDNKLLQEKFGIQFPRAKPMKSIGKFSEKEVYEYFLHGFRVQKSGIRHPELFLKRHIVARYLQKKFRLLGGLFRWP